MRLRNGVVRGDVVRAGVARGAGSFVDEDSQAAGGQALEVTESLGVFSFGSNSRSGRFGTAFTGQEGGEVTGGEVNDGIRHFLGASPFAPPGVETRCFGFSQGALQTPLE